MISLLDSVQSSGASLTAQLDRPGAQVAARPANISKAPRQQTESAAENAGLSKDVSISAEGLRQLQREQNLAAMTAAPVGDQVFAARMAHEMAYGQDELAPSTAMTVKGAPASAAYAASDAESRQEQARFTRIALYEMEKARGTPPELIYRKLQALKAAQPAAQPANVQIGVGG